MCHPSYPVQVHCCGPYYVDVLMGNTGGLAIIGLSCAIIGAIVVRGKAGWVLMTSTRPTLNLILLLRASV